MFNVKDATDMGEASVLGYKKIVLSTIPAVMSQAYAIYKSIGFTEEDITNETVTMVKKLS